MDGLSQNMSAIYCFFISTLKAHYENYQKNVSLNYLLSGCLIEHVAQKHFKMNYFKCITEFIIFYLRLEIVKNTEKLHCQKIYNQLT